MSTLFKFDGLSEEEAKFIVACIGEKPFNMVAGLIQRLGTQLNAQLNIPKEALTGPQTALTDAVKTLPENLDLPATPDALG